MDLLLNDVMLSVTTYPSAGGRHGAHGCVFQGRKMRGKTGKVWSTNFKCERFGSCFYARGRY